MYKWPLYVCILYLSGIYTYFCCWKVCFLCKFIICEMYCIVCVLDKVHTLVAHFPGVLYYCFSNRGRVLTGKGKLTFEGKRLMGWSRAKWFRIQDIKRTGESQREIWKDWRDWRLVREPVQHCVCSVQSWVVRLQTDWRSCHASSFCPWSIWHMSASPKHMWIKVTIVIFCEKNVLTGRKCGKCDLHSFQHLWCSFIVTRLKLLFCVALMYCRATYISGIYNNITLTNIGQATKTQNRNDAETDSLKQDWFDEWMTWCDGLQR
jgi:hypothetical protein